MPAPTFFPLNAQMYHPWGVIFDWDGVVIDSSSQHERSWELLAAERELALPEGHFRAGFGKKNEVIIPSLGWGDDPLQVAALASRKEELYRSLVAEEGVIILPGTLQLLHSLKDKGVSRAIGSSTPRDNLEAIFAATGLGQFFDLVICGSDVSHGKPNPEVFLLGAEGLGLTPERCIVIEDAFAGIEAARRAGMKVVGVATTNPIQELTMCDLAVSTLLEVDPDKLQSLLETFS